MDPLDSRSATFEIIPGVSLYGGFAGDEDPSAFDMRARNFANHETTLSGDLASNDTAGDYSENSYHVISA